MILGLPDGDGVGTTDGVIVGETVRVEDGIIVLEGEIDG